jgi:hypothetical protein
MFSGGPFVCATPPSRRGSWQLQNRNRAGGAPHGRACDDIVLRPAMCTTAIPAIRPSMWTRPRLAVVADQATTSLEQISGLLHEAGETHHRVFRIVDGADDNWASWYADWLINLSELPAVLGVKPVRSQLTYLLVSLDKEYTATQPGEPWETYYAQKILGHFSPQRR